ncbi:staygreen family protein [Bacillus rubiinfantis]|uniref:staygreen family protein n=1 Tax=Bacillus rubiinfantis TaxID=1499680 RepID=UPI0009E2102D|nr:staygreen family protein [Bacillus rubiinfantis]
MGDSFSPTQNGEEPEIFRQELPLALTAIRYGDRLLFKTNPNLDYSFILINFMSAYPQFSRSENWGNFRNFPFK